MMKRTKEDKQKLIDRYFQGEAMSDICLDSGVAKSTFYEWLKPYKSKATKDGVPVDANAFYKQKQHIQKLEQIIEVLQIVNCTTSAPLKERMEELEILQGQYSVRVLCAALKVDRGTFYNHIKRNKKADNSYKERREQLCEHIKRVYDESNQIFGAKKIKAILSEEGIVVGKRW